MLKAHKLPIIMLEGWGAESSQVANNNVGMGGGAENRGREGGRKKNKGLETVIPN